MKKILLFALLTFCLLLAACPGDSQSEDFLKWLGAATSFQAEGEKLAIFLDPASGAFVLAFDPME